MFCATNVYKYTAKDGTLQSRIYRELKRRLTHQDTTQLRHILGRDFNSILTPESRIGSANGKTNQADVLISKFVRDQALANRWWSGRIREGIWTRRHPSIQQAAGIDEILLLDPPELDDDPDDRRRAGKAYSLRTALTCNTFLLRSCSDRTISSPNCAERYLTWPIGRSSKMSGDCKYKRRVNKRLCIKKFLRSYSDGHR